MTVPNQKSGGSNPTPLSVAESFISVALAVTAVDGFLSESEKEALVLNLYTMKIFADYTQAELEAAVDKVIQMMNDESLDDLIQAACDALSPWLRETAFFLAGDMALADGLIGENEATLLGKLQQSLRLEPEIAGKIMDVVLIKNRRLDWPVRDETEPGE